MTVDVQFVTNGAVAGKHYAANLLFNINASPSPGVTLKGVLSAGLQPYYIHSDHLDTPRMITDTTGAVVWQWDNVDPFGNNMADENPSGLGIFNFNLRFPGQYFDKETGLHYNYFRYYDPATGRYIESDPIGLAGGINTYAYVGGNPLRYTDPLGLFEMYGCWGGSNWSGCISAPEIPANPTQPVDALDACYKQHDYCYVQAQSAPADSSSCSNDQKDGNPKPTISSCDTQLAECTDAVDYNKIGVGGHFFGPYSTWWAIIHARITR
ncbi:MAG: hypothetical protein PHP85_13490 [Gallionella sp.]|nr:hypothetical protein [Gallionella sp.]